MTRKNFARFLALPAALLFLRFPVFADRPNMAGMNTKNPAPDASATSNIKPYCLQPKQEKELLKTLNISEKQLTDRLALLKKETDEWTCFTNIAAKRTDSKCQPRGTGGPLEGEAACAAELESAPDVAEAKAAIAKGLSKQNGALNDHVGEALGKAKSAFPTNSDSSAPTPKSNSMGALSQTQKNQVGSSGQPPAGAPNSPAAPTTGAQKPGNSTEVITVPPHTTAPPTPNSQPEEKKNPGFFASLWNEIKSVGRFIASSRITTGLLLGLAAGLIVTGFGASAGVIIAAAVMGMGIGLLAGPMLPSSPHAPPPSAPSQPAPTVTKPSTPPASPNPPAAAAAATPQGKVDLSNAEDTVANAKDPFAHKDSQPSQDIPQARSSARVTARKKLNKSRAHAPTRKKPLLSNKKTPTTSKPAATPKKPSYWKDVLKHGIGGAAVGGLIGSIGGPRGVAIGAAVGALIGAGVAAWKDSQPSQDIPQEPPSASVTPTKNPNKAKTSKPAATPKEPSYWKDVLKHGIGGAAVGGLIGSIGGPRGVAIGAAVGALIGTGVAVWSDYKSSRSSQPTKAKAKDKKPTGS